MGLFNEIKSSALKRDKPALIYKKKGQTKIVSYRKMIELAENLSYYLEKQGIKKGDSLGIHLPNSFEWVISDLAGLRLGAKVVPIYKNISAQDLNFIIKNSKIKILITDVQEKIENVKVLEVNNFEKYLNHKVNQKNHKKINNDDIATICYTSGSSGKPKGALLTHKNILHIMKNQPFKINEKDTFISYLPLSHMFERTCGYYSSLYNGATIVLCKDFSKLMEYCEEFKPTIMLTIPRMIEKMEKKVEENFLSRNLSKTPLLRYLIKKKLRRRLGGRLRFMVSGGAPLDKKLAKKFWKLGIRIYEGYGMTECAPVISSNYENNNKFGSVGIPMKDVKIKIHNGKIFVKAPSVMKGYTNRKLTSERFKKGWLNTGDLGFFDKKGFLHILGREDNCIIMSNGKKTFPEPIEREITKIKGVEQAVVFGSNKPYLTALIYATKNKKELNKYIEKLNQKFSNHQKIRKFDFIHEPLTPENGMLTPTLKVKREEVFKKFKNNLEKLYKWI